MQSSFNNLTQLTAVLGEAQFAILMLLKNEELYCKSCVGLTPEELKQFRTVFASSLLNADDYDCILNIWKDERFKTLNRRKHFSDIKSYHSYRVKTESGKQVGLLVILKNEETVLTYKQTNELNLLAEQVVKLLELNSKNKSLKKCQKQIEKTSKKVDDFASMAAHDLKAPIRNIKSFVELIKSENDWNDENAIYFDFINTSIAKMNVLIDALMDYAKTNINDQHSETVYLDELVLNAFRDSTANHNLNAVNLNKETLPIIQSHTILLSIVIQNLISNAVKYHKKHPIEINVAYKVENGYHSLIISDNGIGIDAAHFNEIFQPFKRLHTHSEFEGSGLGLATCKRIMKNLKGSISVSSILGEGTTFTIKIPFIEQV